MEHGLAVLPELGGLSVVHGSGCHPANPGMTMLEVVPGKEALGPGASIGLAAKALGIIGLILQGFELRFGEGIVVRDVRRG